MDHRRRLRHRRAQQAALPARQRAAPRLRRALPRSHRQGHPRRAARRAHRRPHAGQAPRRGVRVAPGARYGRRFRRAAPCNGADAPVERRLPRGVLGGGGAGDAVVCPDRGRREGAGKEISLSLGRGPGRGCRRQVQSRDAARPRGGILGSRHRRRGAHAGALQRGLPDPALAEPRPRGRLRAAGAGGDERGLRRGRVSGGQARRPHRALVLALASGLAALAAGVALWGLHMGLTQGVLSAMVAHASPAHLRGTAFGVFNLASGLALLVASALAGALWQYVGPEATFWAGAALAAASAAITRVASRGSSRCAASRATRRSGPGASPCRRGSPAPRRSRGGEGIQAARDDPLPRRSR